MGYRYDEFAPGEMYHIFTRGVEQRKIFMDKNDRTRFLALLLHCLPRGVIKSFSIQTRTNYKPLITPSGEGLVDIMCYCLMDNHVHLLIRENIDGGTSLYMRRLLTSYAAYFNRRRKRSGSLFIHPFKAVLVDDDDQLLHVSRYIHLNPYASHIVDDVFAYPWSSLKTYTEDNKSSTTCHHALISEMLPWQEHKTFVQDEADYARSLANIKHLLFDYDDEAN